MQAYKRRLMEQEFPFLTTIAENLEVSLQDIDDIKVERADAGLMSQTGYEESYSWSGGGYHNYVVYYAVAKDGQVTGLNTESYHSDANGANAHYFADPMDSQLLDHGLRPEFIVECVQNDLDANRRGTLTRFWRIMKVEKFDLEAHHLQRVDEAATMLKAEISAAWDVA